MNAFSTKPFPVAPAKVFPTDYLKANGVLLSAAGMERLDHSWFYQGVWYLTEEQSAEFLAVVKNDPYSTYLFGTNEKNMYITGAMEFIIVDSYDIPKQDVLEVNGYQVLKPEVNRDVFYAATSNYAKNMIGVTTESLVQLEMKRLEKVREEKERSKRRLKAIDDFYEYITTRGPRTEEFRSLVNAVMSFDHAYHYTDDNRVWRAAEDRRKALIAKLKTHGFDDGDDIMKKAASAYLM